MDRIAWADPYKTDAEWAVYARNLQAAIYKDVKKYGYRRDV
jgi:hypothetical protein